jgi:hypothetical protein
MRTHGWTTILLIGRRQPLRSLLALDNFRLQTTDVTLLES